MAVTDRQTDRQTDSRVRFDTGAILGAFLAAPEHVGTQRYGEQ